MLCTLTGIEVDILPLTATAWLLSMPWFKLMGKVVRFTCGFAPRPRTGSNFTSTKPGFRGSTTALRFGCICKIVRGPFEFRCREMRVEETRGCSQKIVMKMRKWFTGFSERFQVLFVQSEVDRGRPVIHDFDSSAPGCSMIPQESLSFLGVQISSLFFSILAKSSLANSIAGNGHISTCNKLHNLQ